MTNFEYMDKFMKEQYIELSKINYQVEKNLEVRHVKNATILPVKKEGQALFGKGGVVDEDGKYIEISAQKADKMMDRVNGKYECTQVETIKETVIYMNYFHKHWGHFLIDVVPRMWYLIENNNFPIVFTVNINSEKNNITGNYLEFLKLFGIKKERVRKK